MRALLLPMLLAVLFAFSCGGGGTVQNADPNPPANGGDELNAPLIAQVLRDSSGAPTGIRLSWDIVPGSVVGYYLYKAEYEIPDSVRGINSSRVWINGEKLIPQPVESTRVWADDLFNIEMGVTYHYRVSAVDEDGDESLLSPEETVTAAPFEIFYFEDPTIGVEDMFIIHGRNFGQYNAALDHVEVTGVRWFNGVGFIETEIEATVINWDIDQIRAELPLGATRGPVLVTVGGVSAWSEEDLINTDPYITGITPLSADVTTVVMVSGQNFGDGFGGNNPLVFGGYELLTGGEYLNFFNTQISFNPPNLRDFDAQTVWVRVDDAQSNVAWCNLTNALPQMDLQATPGGGPAPLTVAFDASGSVDPEDTTLTFDWDWEGDGTYDLFDGGSTPTHRYNTQGLYNATVRATDADGGVATISTPIDVSLGNVTITDIGTPLEGDIYADTLDLEVRYNIEGGAPPYSINWILVNVLVPGEVQLAVDNDIPVGNNLHTFNIDTTTALVTEGNNTIPLGQWQIRAEPTDQRAENDPDPPFSWPLDAGGGLGQWNVYRYDIGVIQDGEGDQLGTESAVVIGLLTAMGYNTTLHDSVTVVLGDLETHHAIIWASDDAWWSAGVPFIWLGTADLALIRNFVDTGRSALVFSPPGDSTGDPFVQDPVFQDQYQPFDGVDTMNAALDFELLDYTQQFDYFFNSFSYNGIYGDDMLDGLLPNSVAQIEENLPPPPNPLTGAVRDGPVGGNVYLGMFLVHNITGVDPPTQTVAQLMDNIVAGTIVNQP